MGRVLKQMVRLGDKILMGRKFYERLKTSGFPIKISKQEMENLRTKSSVNLKKNISKVKISWNLNTGFIPKTFKSTLSYFLSAK